jgi:hypothetical protein
MYVGVVQHCLLSRTGLTPDERHISPIENLDHTISRLYSYLSGSEGDAETDHSLTPLKATAQLQEQWASAQPPSPSASSISSRCSSVSAGDDLDLEEEDEEVTATISPLPSSHLHTMDHSTMSSGRSGENFYQRIGDTGQ